MEQTNNIAISILDAKDKENTLYELFKANEKLKDLKIEDIYSNIIHFDVMDKKFVPNVGVDLKYIKIAKKYNFYSDVHLMVKNPIEEKYIDKALEYGANAITVHYEIDNLEKVLNYLKNKNITIGIAIKPDTDIKELKRYEKYFDKILIMTVEPGLGGQKYIAKCNEKIKLASKIFEDKIIQIDGGVNFETIRFGIENGVNSFVVGNTIIKENDYVNTLIKFNIVKSIEELEKKKDTTFDKAILMIKDGGYGEGDILLGISSKDIRKVARKYKKIGLNFKVINFFLNHKYHEYRKLAAILMSILAKMYKDDIDKLKLLNQNILENVDSINNWDLTDEVGPNVVGVYLKNSNYNDKIKEAILNDYLHTKKVFQKRIGIFALLTLVKNGEIKFSLNILNCYLYEKNHLINKACGFILRQIYKKDKKAQIEFLVSKNRAKKLPSILLSYACEKMSKEEKEFIKNI